MVKLNYVNLENLARFKLKLETQIQSQLALKAPNTLASASQNGLMSKENFRKLSNIADGANKYVHPSYTPRTSGLYKITVDSLGHITSVTPATKADITALGIPGQDTTYTHPSTHPASIIVTDASHRFVTDTQISAWNNKANNTVVSTTANGLMTPTLLTKLNGIATGATKVIVDSALSGTSVNALQNKVIYAKFQEMQNKITALETKQKKAVYFK